MIDELSFLSAAVDSPPHYCPLPYSAVSSLENYSNPYINKLSDKVALSGDYETQKNLSIYSGYPAVFKFRTILRSIIHKSTEYI